MRAVAARFAAAGSLSWYARDFFNSHRPDPGVAASVVRPNQVWASPSRAADTGRSCGRAPASSSADGDRAPLSSSASSAFSHDDGRLLIGLGRPVTTTEMMQVVYVRGEPWTKWRWNGVRGSAERYAVRVLPRTRPMLWRAKNEQT
jgi:hypothetical protein